MHLHSSFGVGLNFCFLYLSKLLNSIIHLLEHEKEDKKEKNKIRMSRPQM